MLYIMDILAPTLKKNLSYKDSPKEEEVSGEEEDSIVEKPCLYNIIIARLGTFDHQNHQI